MFGRTPTSQKFVSYRLGVVPKRKWLPAEFWEYSQALGEFFSLGVSSLLQKAQSSIILKITFCMLCIFEFRVLCLNPFLNLHP